MILRLLSLICLLYTVLVAGLSAQNSPSEVFQTVSEGDYSGLDVLLNKGADPDQIGSEGLSPLMKAVLLGREDLVLLLLRAKANPDIISEALPDKMPVSALSLAIDRGEFSIIRRLMDAGSDALMLAEYGKANPLKLPLLSNPIDTVLWPSLAGMRLNASSPDWQGDHWILHQAARDGDWRLVKTIIQNGMDPGIADDYGVTALMSAAWKGHGSVVSLLLDEGASISARDERGWNALCYAAAAGHQGIVQTLIEGDDGQFETEMEASAYYWALLGNSPIILKLLIDNDVPLPEAAEDGMTILMIAAWLSDYFAVSHLLPLVSNPALRDEAGRSALEWSAAAFERDRQRGRLTGQSKRASRNYPIARLLTRGSRSPEGIRLSPSSVVHPDVVEAWAPGINPASAEDWKGLRPSPLPAIPGDGDLTLYRIFRNEEQDKPSS